METDMEKNTIYVVQFWVEGYQYWSNVAELPEGMFALPTVGYETEDAGRAKLSAMREAYPAGQYRLIRKTTTEEVI
jgi:hypothetical protein